MIYSSERERESSIDCINHGAPVSGCEEQRILSWHLGGHAIVLVAGGWMEVEDENDMGPLEDDDLVPLVLLTDKSLHTDERIELFFYGGQELNEYISEAAKL